MKKEQPIIFNSDGIRYVYHYYTSEYDGYQLVDWDDCVWQPDCIEGKKIDEED